MPALAGPPARQRRVLHSYDLLVIGGGINGIGVASDSAGRGLSVLAVEMGDLGAATSWTSSKLILPEMRGDWTQDVLWRRSKCGLRLDARARDRVAAFLGR